MDGKEEKRPRKAGDVGIKQEKLLLALGDEKASHGFRDTTTMQRRRGEARNHV